MKKVTVMIPTYNQPQYIEQCIDSVLLQNYQNLEIVISDDSLNDDTKKIILEKYIQDSRIRYFHNQVRLGRVGNYHDTLYNKAAGDYVINLDGDDWFIESNYISRAAEILDNNPDVACVIAKIQFFHESDQRIEYGEGYNELETIDDGGKYLYLVSHLKAPFNHMTVLYRRDIAMQIGFYTKDTTWTDSESIFRLVCNSRMAFLNEYVGVWRIHGSNESGKYFGSITYEEVFSVDESIYSFCSKCEKKPFGVSAWINESRYHNAKGYILYLVKTKQFIKLLLFLRFFFQRFPMLCVVSVPRVFYFMLKKVIASMYRKIKKI